MVWGFNVGTDRQFGDWGLLEDPYELWSKAEMGLYRG